MTLVWNNCRLVYDDKFVVSPTPKEKRDVKSLIQKYGPSRVWQYLKTKEFFGINQNSLDGASGKERSFLSRPEKFLTEPGRFCGDCGGKQFCDETIGTVLDGEVKETTEYIIHQSPVLRNAKDKTIMIVGGGPSAVEADWTQYEYDQLWSCNHFFLNKKLASRNVDLWMCADEVDLLGDKRLHKYLKEVGKNSWHCLYPTRAPIQRATTEGTHQYIKDVQKVIPNITYAHLRYRSKIGIMPRLLLLAIFAGASKVYVVGMDGLPTNRTTHAFEPGKKPKGTCAKPHAKDVFNIQYVQLWDYILYYLRPDTEIVNLGENTKGNLSAAMTKSINNPHTI